MELNEMATFLEVMKQGSFSRAAAKLNMTQPAVSRHVQRLEEDLNARLFYRNGRGVVLTPAGERLSSTVGPLLSNLSEVCTQIRETANRPEGAVSVGIPYAIGRILSSWLLRTVQQQLPHAQIQVVEAFSATLTDWVEDGQIDLAVVYDTQRARNIVSSPLVMEDLFLMRSQDICGPIGDVGVEALDGIPLLLPPGSNPIRKVLNDAAKSAGIFLNVLMETDSVVALQQLAEQGVGNTVMPFSCFTKAEGRTLNVQRIKPSDVRINIVAITPRHRRVTTATQATIALVTHELRDRVKSGSVRGGLGVWKSSLPNVASEPVHTV